MSMSVAICLVAVPATGCSVWLGTDDLEGNDATPRPSVMEDAGSDGTTATPDAEAEPMPDAALRPVDVAGDYTLSVTNEANACQFAGWRDGGVVVGVPLKVMQDNELVVATIEGATGAFVELVLGSRAFGGEVAGAELELTLVGTIQFRQANCEYTVNAVMAASLDGDAIEGTIEYRPTTNGSPSCGVLDECSSTQRFNGTRPPSN